MSTEDYDEIYADGAVPTQLDAEDQETTVEPINNVADMEEYRRLTALDMASRANPATIEELLDGAARVVAFLADGSINAPKGSEGTNSPL